LKHNIQSFFDGNAKLRVSKSLFYGGYKYIINILYPSSNINQLKLDFSALRGLFYASISTASDDQNKKPVIHYNEEKNISIFLHQEDNIRCPLFCAKLNVNSTDHVNIDITRGIVTFRAVVINLPLGTLSSLSRPVYIPEIHIITLSNPRKGSFRLRINFDELDPFVNSYLTRPIRWDAPASLNDESGDADNTGNNSIGESFQSKIQAVPYIGRVIVSREDLLDEQGKMSFRKWYLTYTSYVGNLPSLSLHSTYNMPPNSSLTAETGAQGKAYVLSVILSSGESGPLHEIRTRGFKVEP